MRIEKSDQQTMPSTELLAIINSARAEAGETEIRRNKFAEKIEAELEGEHYTKRVVQNLNGTESTIYELTRDQCMLVSMRESRAVRRNVLAKLNAMTSAPKEPQNPRLASPDALVELAKLTLEHLPNLGANSKQALLSSVTKAALGIQVIPLPVITEHHMNATEVGELLGISAAMVGRLANKHGLKTAEHGETRLDKSRHSSKQVESFVYNRAGVDRLRSILAETA